jgi:hypothetical protein
VAPRGGFVSGEQRELESKTGPRISGQRYVNLPDPTRARLDTGIPEAAAQLQNALMPFLRERAERHGLALANEMPLEKVGDSYRLPQPMPGAGLYERVAFRGVMEERYVRQVAQDFELKAADLQGRHWLDPEAMHASLLTEAQGRLAGVDPSLRGTIESRFGEIIGQRVQPAVVADYGRRRENDVGWWKGYQERELNLALDAASLGQTDQAGRHYANVLTAQQALVDYETADPKSLATTALRADAILAGGALLHEVNGAVGRGAYSPGMLGLLGDMLLNAAPPDASLHGHSTRSLQERVPDPEIRSLVAQRLNQLAQREQQAWQAQAEERKDAAIIAGIQQGRPLVGVSEDEEAAAVQRWAEVEGFDLGQPAGLQAAFIKLGGRRLPERLIKGQFEGIRNRSPREMDRALALYDQLGNLLHPDGYKSDLTHLLSVDDKAFMYQYRIARTGAATPEEAAETARRALAASDKLDLTKPDVVRAELIKRLAKAGTPEAELPTIEQLWDQQLDNDLPWGWSYGSLGPRAREFVEARVLQLVLRGDIPPEVAIKDAVAALKTWKEQPFSLEAAQARNQRQGLSGFFMPNRVALVPPWEAVPELPDAKSDEKTTAYIVGYGRVALAERLGPVQSIPGIPPGEELEIGRNVFFQPAGQRSPGNNRQLHYLVFFDEKTRLPAILLDQEGLPILVDVGKAARAQEAAVGELRKEYGKTKAEFERARDEAYGQRAPYAGLNPNTPEAEAAALRAEMLRDELDGMPVWAPFKGEDILPAESLPPAPPPLDPGEIRPGMRLGNNPANLRPGEAGASPRTIREGDFETLLAVIPEVETPGEADPDRAVARVDPARPEQERAAGRYQVLPSTAKDILVRRLGRPEAAEMSDAAMQRELLANPALVEQVAGIVLQEALDKYGSVPLAYAAYHSGQGNIDTLLEKYGDPRTGGITLEGWLDAIERGGNPKTAKYVRDTMGILARRGGTPGEGAVGNLAAYPDLDSGLRATGRYVLALDARGGNTTMVIGHQLGGAKGAEMGRFLARHLGVRPDQALNLRDPLLLGRTIWGIAAWESGRRQVQGVGVTQERSMAAAREALMGRDGPPRQGSGGGITVTELGAAGG